MILSVILFISHMGITSGAKPAFNNEWNPPFKEKNAYNKYDKYPPYCSTPEEMEKRAVPPLQGISDGSSRLVHVTAIIRHGARTPFRGAPEYKCWDGYWEDEETGVWDCDLKTYISPPAAEKGQQVVDSAGMLEEEPDFLFEKRYDALTISPGKTGNSLNGTCQLGQLLLRGYDQELRNGLHLRQAYFYDGDNTADEHAASDSRMRLWDLTKDNESNIAGRKESSPAIGDPSKQIYQEPNLQYRADDEQRTLMSGQVLLRGLFEKELLSADDDETTVIRLHTADKRFDVLGINHDVCPKTVDLYLEAYKSEEYKKLDDSKEFNAVKKFAKEELDMDKFPFSMLDCLMTTICTDRTLPETLNDYDGSLEEFSIQESGEYTNMFERIANYAVVNFTFPYKYNNAAYPKLGMGPLWKEIMTNINQIVDSTNNPTSGTPPPKLALFSGHDTTLMPILATLGDKVWSGAEWSPYASMMQIEIHEMLIYGEGSDFPSGFAFRLIYNGQVLTSKMDGCTEGSELCDSQVLTSHVMPFAKYQERDCARTTEAPLPDDTGKMTEMKAATESLIAAPGGVWVVILLVIFSAALGSAMTVILNKRQSKKYREYRRDCAHLGDLSMEAVGEDEHYKHEASKGIDSAVSANGIKFDENNLI